MNPLTVRNEKRAGEPIYFGDASNEAILEFAQIRHARILIIAISDPTSTRAIVAQSKKLNHDLYLITRTRFVQEVQALYELGADEVIPEEYETSIEIFTRVLTKYMVPRDEIEKFIHEIRSDGYEMLRSIARKPLYSDISHHIPHYDVCSIRIDIGHHFAGKTLQELQLRNKYDITVLALKRGEKYIPNPQADMYINEQNILIAWGERNTISKFIGKV